MTPPGSSKQLDYEASADWTTYGTWRAPFSLFQGVARRHEGSFEGSCRRSNRRHQAVPKSHSRSNTPIVIRSAVDDSRASPCRVVCVYIACDGLGCVCSGLPHAEITSSFSHL